MAVDLKTLFYLIRHSLDKRWVRFGLVGAIATGTYYLLGFLFVSILDWPLFRGNALAYAISFLVSYLGQSKWTFEARGKQGRMLLKFAAAQIFGLGFNTCIIGACNKFHISYELSMLIASGLVPVVVYIICKYWVFRTPAKN